MPASAQGPKNQTCKLPMMQDSNGNREVTSRSTPT